MATLHCRKFEIEIEIDENLTIAKELYMTIASQL